MPPNESLPVPESEIFPITCGCVVRIHCQVARMNARACVLYTQRKECFERQVGQVLSQNSCKLADELPGAMKRYATAVREQGWTLVAEPREL